MSRHEDDIQKMDQHTLVPVGLAISVISTVVVWGAHIQFTAQAMAEKLATHMEWASGEHVLYVDDMKTLRGTLGSIDHRLSIIEGELKRIKK